MTTMQALVLHAVGDVRHEAIPRPKPSAGGVLVRIGSCGVCGSDIPRVFVKGTYRFPTVCGHEFAGTVAEVGAGVTDFGPGDRVAVFPLLWCGKCGPCEKGQYAQCVDYDYLGSRSDGGFAEYVVAPRQNLVRVPDSVSLEEAAMTEPAAVALHALRRAGGCSVGDTVAVFGVGPIGLMVAQWARAMGASRVILCDIVPEKLALAERLGFTDTVNGRQTDPVQAIEGLTDGEGAHLCVEAAGVPQTTAQALKAVRRGGRMVLLGNPGADVTLPVALLSQVMRREVTIFGTWNSVYSASGGGDDWRTALEAMASKKLDLLPLITHRATLAGGADALRMMRDGSEFSSKILIQPNPKEPRP